MDKDEFRARVAELAIIQDAKITKAKDKSRAADEIHEVVYDQEIIEISSEDNPTLSFDLIKLKPISKLCELPNCGKIVDNQIIEYRHVQTPQPHWRIRCENCQCYLHPDGETLIDDSRQVYAIEYQWVRNGGKLNPTCSMGKTK
jgi:hypothetical protein